MSISLIVAMANNRVIGQQQQMPWHLPADLRHFRRLTLHKPVIMGRRTYESIGQALPKRRNIVVSRQADFAAVGIEVCGSLAQALSVVDDQPEIMVIGGQMLFTDALPLASRLYVTDIDLEVVGDTFFPVWEASEWQLMTEDCHVPDEENPYPYCFRHYERINKLCH